MTLRRLNWICAALALTLSALCAFMGSLSGVVICLLGAAFWALQATMSPVNGEVLEAPLTWVTGVSHAY